MPIVRRRRDQIDTGVVDWARVDAATDEDIVRWAAEDPDTPPPATDAELAAAVVVRPAEAPRGIEPSPAAVSNPVARPAAGVGRR